MSFGELIRASRRRLNLSLQEVATALGVTAVYISEVERGKRPPFTIDKMPNLAKILQLDLNELKNAAWKGRKVIDLESVANSKQIDALMALARGGLSDSELDEVLDIANRSQMKIF